MNTLVYDKNTPVLFLIFNRPDNTAKVFEAIRSAKPKKLYVSADGPRTEEEKTVCEQTRAILKNIDWECTVLTNLSEHNKGCRVAMSEGISWFFKQEEEGIILEDDCLPSASFFAFCSTLLAHYRYDTRITHIGGSNFQLGTKRSEASYYFSNLTPVWGWASWRRTWNNYDVDLKSFPSFKEQDLINNCQSHFPFKEGWLNALEKTYNGEIDTWDYQYAYANLINHGLSVIPNVNLISNIGFGPNATHTFDQNYVFASLPTGEINTITHLRYVIPNVQADVFTQEKESYIPPRKNKLSRMWKNTKSFLKKR
ncbi:nucleotide-diphospho-sugar transferase [Pedobacter nyackensis]|uniref:nucleotide-diphospho-sugar transferase n=1 Tax=Pedobacter nyackensis TaxID=475255 RepID=UPI00292EA58D|nr:nucleotide-diphospho-sugar transferase [Pedobacter nyackensis]